MKLRLKQNVNCTCVYLHIEYKLHISSNSLDCNCNELWIKSQRLKSYLNIQWTFVFIKCEIRTFIKKLSHIQKSSLIIRWHCNSFIQWKVSLAILHHSYTPSVSLKSFIDLVMILLQFISIAPNYIP